jgi:hypothetical protein
MAPPQAEHSSLGLCAKVRGYTVSDKAIRTEDRVEHTSAEQRSRDTCAAAASLNGSPARLRS